MNKIKDALDKAQLAIEFYQRRLNEQGFYSPNKQPEVLEALEAIQIAKEEINREWHHPNPNEVYDLIRIGAADGGWMGYAKFVSNFLETKNRRN